MAHAGSAGVFGKLLDTVFKTVTALNKRSNSQSKVNADFHLVGNHGLFQAIESATSRKIPVFRDVPQI
jgi:hypothetical protein